MKLLVFDFDGTLFYEPTQSIPPDLAEVLAELYPHYYIAIITGRWEIPPEFLNLLPHHIRATNNGGCLLHGSKVIRAHYLHQTDVQTVMNHIPPEVELMASSHTGFYVSHPESELFSTWWEVQVCTPQPIQQALDDDILKLNMVSPQVPSIRKQLENVLPHLTFTGGIPPYADFLSVMPKEANKGRALKEIAQLLNVDLKHTYAFGDSDNDIEMLKTAGHAVQIGNMPYLQDLAHSTVGSPLELAQWLNSQFLRF